MSGVLAMAQHPQVDAVYIKALIDSLDDSSCTNKGKINIGGAQEEGSTFGVKWLRHQALSNVIGKAVQVSSSPGAGVARYNFDVLSGYLESFPILETVAKKFQGTPLPMPPKLPKPSPEALGAVQSFLQEKTDTLAFACKPSSCLVLAPFSC